MQAIHKTRQPELTQAVIDQLGADDAESTLADIARHGADAGWPGFTYYSDTVSFAEANLKAIMARLAEDAEDMGAGSAFELVAGFNCLKGENFTPEAIAEAIYNPENDNRQGVYNALAWYAVEEIARELNPEI